MGRRSAVGQVATGAAYVVSANPGPYIAPFVGAFVNLVLSLLLSLAWGSRADPTVWDTAWRSALLVVSGASLVVVTWAAGKARQPVLRWSAMAYTGLSCVWAFLITFRPLTLDMVLVYLITTMTASMCLAAVKLLRGDGTDPGQQPPSPFGVMAERVQELKNVASLGKPTVIDGVVKTRVKMEPGVEFAQLGKAQGAIATGVPTKKSNVRLVPDRDNPGEGDMEITARDYISEPPSWPGLSAPGGSIARPVRLCVYGNGVPVPLHLFGDRKTHRNAIGIMIIAGQQGSGKTELVLGLAAEILSRHDVELTVIDPRKGEQLPRWLSRSVRTISDVDEAEKFVAGLPQQVAERAGVLGRAGFKEWAEGCPVKAQVLIIDEAAKLIAERSEEDLVELAESVRSVGILIALVMQRVTVDRMPSSVKKQRGAVLCLGLADDKEAARVLSEATMEAGASPGSLANREPGSLWVEAPGIPEEDWSRKCRTYEPPKPEELEAAVAPFTGGPKPPSAGALVPDTAEGELEPEPDDPDGLDRRDNDPKVPRRPADPLLDGVDPRDPGFVPKAPRVRFDDGSPTYSKVQLLNLVGNFILDAYAHGRREIRQADMGALIEHVGADNLKPPRLSGYLKELAEPGPKRLLRKKPGSIYWHIEPGEDVPIPELSST